MYVSEVQMLDHNGRHSISFIVCINKNNCLHSDGRIFPTREYFPTREDAQKILDKFHPKPEHVWENGDVFESGVGLQNPMIYHHYGDNRKDQVFSLDVNIGGPARNFAACLGGATFLFNIKEKLCQYQQ